MEGSGGSLDIMRRMCVLLDQRIFGTEDMPCRWRWSNEGVRCSLTIDVCGINHYVLFFLGGGNR